MGDRYTKNDLHKVDGKYIDHARANIEFLFNSEPFKEYQDHFNAYIIFAESEIVISNGTVVNHTVFGSTLVENPYSSTGMLKPIIEDLEAVNTYVYKVKGRNRTEKDLILMSINNISGGTATYNSNLGVFGDGKTGTMLHEVGHAFGGLGDEYYRINYTGPNFINYPNVDFTNDLSLIKWNHFIGLSGYEDVGAYEGGAYQQFGAWRPEYSSIMRGNIGPFNAPSREAIVKRIMSIRGFEYTFENFLANDIANQNRISNNTSLNTDPIHCMNH